MALAFAGLAMASVAVQLGVALPPWLRPWFERLDLAVAAGFAAALVLAAVRHPPTLRHYWVQWLALAVSAGGFVWLTWGGGELPAGAPTPAHLYLLVTATIIIVRTQERLLSLGVRSVALLVGSFAVLVMAGTALLVLPRASAPGVAPLSVLDAVFTATSAACVTGLSVRDVGTVLSPFGQAILLALIQLGGLGIITFVLTLTVVSGRPLSVPHLVAIREMVTRGGILEARRQVAAIAGWVAAIELGGAALLYVWWPRGDGSVTWHVWRSLFHAVSAFCNAGFALEADSLIGLRDHAGVVVVMMGLILLGGLGMPVVWELVGWRPGRPGRAWSVHTNLALVTTVALFAVGTLGFWLLEDLPGLGAAFQSATMRTAGFTTVPIDEERPATLVMSIVLMAIGAGPVSTGGGMKTVTFAILLLAVRALATGRDRVEVYGRTLARRTVLAAISVFVLYVLAAVTLTFLLAVFDPQVKLSALSFEAVSALSTVGLSTGITPGLSAGGKIVLCVAMFVGRVGPLAMAMIVLGRRAPTRTYEYPEETVVVG